MAIFANGYNGDLVSLDRIIQTLNAKTYLVPGITANRDLSVTAGGESAYFYTRSKSTVTDEKTVGQQITFKSAGVKRVDIPISRALYIEAVIPNVNSATVAADVVQDKVIQETIEISNKYNVKFIENLVQNGAKKTSTANNAYDKIVDALAAFKVDNAKNAVRPSSIIISSAMYGELLKDPRFIRATELGDSVLTTAVVGMVAGLYVIEAPELEAEFILISPEGVAAPLNVNSLEVAPGLAAGYPGGTLIGGEIGFNFKVVTSEDDETLGEGGYFVAVYSAE